MSWFQKPIRRGESVVFFPTFAYRDADRAHWRVEVRGWVFVPKERPLVRRALLRMIRRGLRLSQDEMLSPILRKRLQAFLVNNKRRKLVSIRLGEEVYALSPSLP